MSAKTDGSSGITKAPTVPVQVRGVPVSGRPWKKVQVKRNSAMKAKSLRPGWEKQQELRKQREVVKTLEKEMKAEKQAEKDLKKAALEERRKRREENERKAEVVQIVSAAKVKRMKKKQLRQIRKAAGSGHTDKIKSKTKK
ncbi:hypothetical protein HDU97_008587 [Phlyctochytrium planicorne]|nr:hypothetical protein HDU97_008587 [Phlyctochytrium planicorne]